MPLAAQQRDRREPLVEQRIRDALAAGDGWDAVSVERRPVDESDEALAERLLRGPRAQE